MISTLFSDLSSLSPDKKAKAGGLINELKNFINQKINDEFNAFSNKDINVNKIDISVVILQKNDFISSMNPKNTT